MSQEWKLVPLVPTEEMIAALAKAPLYQEWSAILAAAPSPPECSAPVAIVDDNVEELSVVRAQLESSRDLVKFLRGEIARFETIFEPTHLVCLRGGEKLLELCAPGGSFIGVSWDDMAEVLKAMIAASAIGSGRLPGEVTRLQAENAALQQRLNVADQRVDELTAENARLHKSVEDERLLRRNHAERIHELSDETKDLQSELTKALELLNQQEEFIDSAWQWLPVWLRKTYKRIAHQSAPVAKDGE